MNPYLEPPGFLGTGASLLADLTLLAYVLLLVPGMVAGYVFARRNKHRPHHKVTMVTITVVNWLLIAFLMIVAYRFDVADNLPAKPTNPRYLLPTIHGILGLAAQVLATYVVYRMLREDMQVARAKRRGEKNLSQYWFKNAKRPMQLVLVLWLATSLLGVFNYLIRYDVIPPSLARAPVPAPAATPEVSAPQGTAEATMLAPVTTAEAMAATGTPPVEPAETSEAAAVAAPVETAEAEAGQPLSTLEASATIAAPVETAEAEAGQPASTPETKAAFAAPVETSEAEPGQPLSTLEASATGAAPVETAEIEADQPLSTLEASATSAAPVETSEAEPGQPASTPEVGDILPQPLLNLIGRLFRFVLPPIATPEVSIPFGPATTPEVSSLRAPATTPEVSGRYAPVVTPEVEDDDHSGHGGGGSGNSGRGSGNSGSGNSGDDDNSGHGGGDD